MKRSFMAIVVVVLVCVAGGAPASASDGSKPPSLEFLGQAIVPTGTTFAGTTVGGLSSITYDAARGVFYSLSDDPSQFQPARFYTVRVDVSDGHLDNGDVAFTGVTTLQAPGGGPYPPPSLDPEGLTLTKSGELIVTSEGIANRSASRRGCGATRSTGRSSATSGAGRVPADEPDARRAPEPRVRGGCGGAERQASVRRHGGRARAGRSSRDAHDRERVAHPPLQPVDRAPGARSTSTSNDRVAEPPVPATNFSVNGLVELLPVQRPVHALDGALVLGRSAGNGQHDQALLGRVSGGGRRERRSTASPG